MSELTPEQLRELDAEIAKTWFGDKPDPSKSIPFSSEQYCHPHYSTDPAASMMLLKKVAEICDPITQKRNNQWFVMAIDFKPVSAPTLELAIALFARKLKEKE